METTAKDDLAYRWYKVRNFVKENFDNRPDINVCLFLIGMNEVGQVKEVWEKEEKQFLMHVATCKLLSSEGYFEFTHTDAEGWPHYEPSKSLPPFNMREQESLLKLKIVEYMEEIMPPETTAKES